MDTDLSPEVVKDLSTVSACAANYLQGTVGLATKSDEQILWDLRNDSLVTVRRMMVDKKIDLDKQNTIIREVVMSAFLNLAQRYATPNGITDEWITDEEAVRRVRRNLALEDRIPPLNDLSYVNAGAYVKGYWA